VKPKYGVSYFKKEESLAKTRGLQRPNNLVFN